MSNEKMSLVYVYAIPEPARNAHKGHSKYADLVKAFESSGERFARVDGIERSNRNATSVSTCINKAAKVLGSGVKACVRKGCVYVQRAED